MAWKTAISDLQPPCLRRPAVAELSRPERHDVLMQQAAARDALQAPGSHARIAPILAGVRGEAPVDLTVVARTAVAFGALAGHTRSEPCPMPCLPNVTGSRSSTPGVPTCPTRPIAI